MEKLFYSVYEYLKNFLYVEDVFRIDYKYLKICIMLNAINWYNNYHILSPVSLNIHQVTRGLFVIVARSCHPLCLCYTTDDKTVVTLLVIDLVFIIWWYINTFFVGIFMMAATPRKSAPSR